MERLQHTLGEKTREVERLKREADEGGKQVEGLRKEAEGLTADAEELEKERAAGTRARFPRRTRMLAARRHTHTKGCTAIRPGALSDHTNARPCSPAAIL
eukprot:scaffold14670_cov108-Isochrysis_galbana.AAC.7